MALLTADSDVLPLLLLIVSSALAWWLLQESKVRKFLKQIPGPTVYPVIGNALEFLDPQEFYNTLSSFPEKYGNRVKMILGSNNNLILCHPDDLEKILSSPATIAKSDIYKFFIPWLGSGLFLSKGPKWQERRRILNQIFFHSKFLPDFQTVFNEQAQVMVDIIQEKITAGENLVKMHELFMRVTLDIIYETTMGAKLNSQRDPHNLYAEALAKAGEDVFKRIVSPWLHPDLIYKYSGTGREALENLRFIRCYFAKLINERKLLLKNKLLPMSEDKSVPTRTKGVDCVLDFLIQKQEQEGVEAVSDEEIRDEMNSLMFGGHDTTSAHLKWTLLLLGSHPEAQEKVHEELNQVFAKDKERPISNDDLANLKYLECCIKESLRLYPVSSIFARNMEEDFKLDEDTVLPKGLDVFISPYITHRLPEFFPDPEEFRPSRHFPENCIGRHPYAFIPFSAGPKNCQGIKFTYVESKIILATIFRNFNVRAVDDPASLVVFPKIIIKPKNDIGFQFTAK